ncbi:MAG: hypothetical protein IJZ36_02235 [Bacilli bacterium]|nr:hypothetical protein [Bacilli bacterium]
MVAKGLLLEKQDDIWTEKYVSLDKPQDILTVLQTNKKSITQVDIDKYRKVFYSMDNLERYGSISAMMDANDERWYMVAPLLLVECNDTEPIMLSKKVEQEIKELIKLY